MHRRLAAEGGAMSVTNRDPRAARVGEDAE